MAEHWRCAQHGGLAGRPPGAPMHPNTAAALQAGRARWVERMRLAKQQGLIAKFPNGRRPRGASKLHPNRTVRRAQKIIEARMAKETAFRVVGNPGVNDTALEPRASRLEQSTEAARPEAAESEGSAVAAAESPGEADTLLEELVIAMIDAPNPLNAADKTDSLWTLVAGELSDGLWDRLDTWIDKRTSSE
jgi:hypothetical protein